MKYNLKTLEDIDFSRKKVLLRVAYDITLARDGGMLVVPTDARIRATIPTIEYLLEKHCSIALLSWLKRPAGKVVDDLRMKPIAARLSELIDRPVVSLPDCVGPEVKNHIANMKPRDIVMLENVRFHPEEERGDNDFARELVEGLQVIVYDAFGQAHRVHSSTTGILQYLPAVAGRLFVREIEHLSNLLDNPSHPFVAVMGGAKISDRIGVMKSLIHKADKVLIGGALANTFLLAEGKPVEKSLVEDIFVDEARGKKQDYLAICRNLMEEAGAKLQLPIDLLAAPDINSEETRVINLDQNEALPKNWGYYDIGPRTAEVYERLLQGAKLVFGNGPMGYFEKPQFAAGTRKVAEAMVASGATTVIGGGDTESMVGRFNLQGKFTHVSTGGGAALEFLAGKEFPVMKYLIK